MAWKPCRLPVIVMSWVRVSRSRTGRPVSVAPSAATAARPCGCISLPPKPPPIRRHCTVTRLLAQAEHVRHDLLGLGGVLGARLDEDLAVLVDQSPASSASRGRSAPARPSSVTPSKTCAGPREPGRRVAPMQERLRALEALGRDRLGAPSGSRAAPRSRPRPPPRPGGPPRGSRRGPSTTACPWYITSDGNSGSSCLTPASLMPGHVGGGQHPDHARHVVRRRRVEPGDAGVGVRRLHRVGVQARRGCGATRSSV